MRGLVTAIVICGLSATAAASLEKEVIRKAIKKHIREVIACYEQPNTPRDTTTIVKFVIGTDGKVSKIVATGPTMLGTCLAKVIAGIVFPKSTSATLVTYPFSIIFAGDWIPKRRRTASGLFYARLSISVMRPSPSLP